MSCVDVMMGLPCSFKRHTTGRVWTSALEREGAVQDKGAEQTREAVNSPQEEGGRSIGSSSHNTHTIQYVSALFTATFYLPKCYSSSHSLSFCGLVVVNDSSVSP